jgi:hypothetical protein
VHFFFLQTQNEDGYVSLVTPGGLENHEVLEQYVASTVWLKNKCGKKSTRSRLQAEAEM